MFGFMMVDNNEAPPPPLFDPGFAYINSNGYAGPLAIEKWDFDAETISIITSTLTLATSYYGGFSNFDEGIWAGGYDGFNNPGSYVDKIVFADETIAAGTTLSQPDYGWWNGCSIQETGLMPGQTYGHLYDYAGETWSISASIGGVSSGGRSANNETIAVVQTGAGTSNTLEYTFATDTAVDGFRLSGYTEGIGFGDANYAVFAYGSTVSYAIEAYVYSDGTYPTLQSFGVEAGGVIPAREAGAASNANVGGMFGGTIYASTTDRIAYYHFADFTLSVRSATIAAPADTTFAFCTSPGGLVSPVHAPPGASSAGTQYIDDAGFGDGYSNFCNIELRQAVYDRDGYFMLCEVMFDLQDAGGPPNYDPVNAAGFTIQTPPGWTFIRRDNQAHVTSALYYRFSQSEPSDTAPYDVPGGGGATAGGGGVSYYFITDMPYYTYGLSIVNFYTNVDPADPIFAHAGTSKNTTVFLDSLTLGVGAAAAFDRVVFSGSGEITNDANDDYPSEQLEVESQNGPDNLTSTKANAPGTVTRTMNYQTNIGDPIILQAVSLNRGYSPLSTAYPTIYAWNDFTGNVAISFPAGVIGTNGLFLLSVLQFNTQGGLPASNYTCSPPAGWTLLRSDNNGKMGTYIFYKFSLNEFADPVPSHTFPNLLSYAGMTIAYSGINTGTPVAAHAYNGTLVGGGPVTIDCPSVTPNGAGDVLLSIVCSDFETMFGWETFPLGMSARLTDYFMINEVHDQVLTSGAATGVRTFGTTNFIPTPTAQAYSIVLRKS